MTSPNLRIREKMGRKVIITEEKLSNSQDFFLITLIRLIVFLVCNMESHLDNCFKNLD